MCDIILKEEVMGFIICAILAALSAAGLVSESLSVMRAIDAGALVIFSLFAIDASIHAPKEK
jgi:hypothetical protein